MAVKLDFERLRGFDDRQTDRLSNICNSRVTFGTEKKVDKFSTSGEFGPIWLFTGGCEHIFVLFSHFSMPNDSIFSINLGGGVTKYGKFPIFSCDSDLTSTNVRPSVCPSVSDQFVKIVIHASHPCQPSMPVIYASHPCQSSMPVLMLG